ncbi:MAG: hypothetical protein V1906_00855 [Candidatus Woesearchaeota archaeon]
MEQLPLDRLFERKIKVHSTKYRHIYNIFYTQKTYFGIFHSVLFLKKTLMDEIAINKQIVRKVRRMYMMSRDGVPYLYSLEGITNRLIKTLEEEYDVIKDIGITSVVLHDYKVIFSKKYKHSYLTQRCLKFRGIYDKETIVNKELIEEIYARNRELRGIAGFDRERRKFMDTGRLIVDSQRLLKLFVRSIGNNEAVMMTGRQLLKLLGQLQRTEMYEFVNQDVTAIKKKIKYVMQHPMESKLTTLFTGIYLITPGSFETTATLLTLRFLTKYTIKKSKHLFNRDKSIRRKVRRMTYRKSN